jgi:hypothetical protein
VGIPFDRGRPSRRSKVRSGASRAVPAAKPKGPLWVQRGDLRRNACQRAPRAESGRSPDEDQPSQFDPNRTPKIATAGRLAAGRLAICFASIAWPLYVTLELRATKSQVMRESAVMISSFSPVNFGFQRGVSSRPNLETNPGIYPILAALRAADELARRHRIVSGGEFRPIRITCEINNPYNILTR